MMSRRHSGILLFLLLTTPLSSFAQQSSGDEPKADTVAGDTIFVTKETPNDPTHLDTSYSSTPETGSAVVETSPILRHIPDTTVYRWQHDPRYAYANNPDHWKIPEERPSDFSIWLSRVLASDGFHYAILTLLGILLLYAVIRIVMENNLGAFYRRGRKARGSDDDAEGLSEQEDIDKQLQHFLSIGDKRQATRYLYLKALQLLSERNLIRWHADATNQEYLRQLNGTPQGTAFRLLTGAYEKVWYGDFVLSESTFQRLREHFTDFYKTLDA